MSFACSQTDLWTRDLAAGSKFLYHSPIPITFCHYKSPRDQGQAGATALGIMESSAVIAAQS